MRVLFSIILILSIIPVNAYATSEQLSAAEAKKDGALILALLQKEAEKYPNLRYKLKEISRSHGSTTVKGKTIPITETLEATISLATDSRFHIDYREHSDETSKSQEGFLICDGKTLWSSDRQVGRDYAYITKQPIDLQDEITKAMEGMRPELSTAATLAQSCSYGNFLTHINTWRPRKTQSIFDAIGNREVSFVSAEIIGKEKFYNLRLLWKDECSQVDFSISERGLLSKLTVFNPYVGYQEVILGTQEYSDYEVTPSYPDGFFTYDEKISKSDIVDMGARKAQTIEMLQDTFAMPPKKIFAMLFSGESESVKNLGGGGGGLMGYQYTLRFEAEDLPKWRNAQTEVAAELEEQKEFFAQTFEGDAEKLKDNALLEATAYSGIWVLHNKKTRSFFVRYWGGG